MARSSSVYGGSDEAYFQDCDVCKYRNKTSEALAYCTSCADYLCATCEKVHRCSELTRNHRVLTGSSLPSISTTSTSTSPKMFCEEHKTMIVTMYCQSHDVTICNTCKLSNHRRCNTTNINQQAKQMKKDGSFQDTGTLLADLKSKYDKMKVMRNADKGIVKSDLDKCLQDMREIRKNINEAFDDIENTLSKEIHQVYERTNKDIENHIAILDDALAQISYQVKFLKECEKARADDVMYVAMKKASKITRKYEDIILNMEDEHDRTEMTFQINGELFDMVKHLRSIGTVLINNSRFSIQTNKNLTDGQGTSRGISYSRQTQKSLINMSVSGKRVIDIGYTGIYGCTFIPDGNLVLCCGDDGLLLLDKDFNVKSSLNVHAHHVAVIDRNEIVIVSEGGKQIQKVKLLPSMEVTKTMRTDKGCYGIDVSGDEIYVTCHDLSGNGDVHVLNMNGEVRRVLGANNGEYRFTRPGYVTVNTDGSKVFVSEWATGIVTCLDRQGRVHYQYSDIGMKCPAGTDVDRASNLLVCGSDSNTVHIIGHNGRKEKMLLSETDGVNNPRCTAFRQSDGCLVVGMATVTTRSLISFTVK